MSAEVGGVERGAGPGPRVGGQRLRSLEAEQGRVGGLAGGGVLAGRLAEVGGRAFDVEHVVDDLEGEADFAAEDADGADRRRVGAGHRRPGHGGRLDQRAGLARVHVGQRRGVEGRPGRAVVRAHGVEVDRLAADHAGGAGGGGDHADRLQLARDDGRMRVVRLARQPGERLGEEAVADEDRLALAEADVRRRPSAAQVVVVHRRQVVVDQRVGVNQLERTGRRHGEPAGLGLGAEDGVGGGQRQERTDAFAAAEQRIAQAGVEHGRRRWRRRNGPAQAGIDRRAHPRDPGGEGVRARRLVSERRHPS